MPKMQLLVADTTPLREWAECQGRVEGQRLSGWGTGLRVRTQGQPWGMGLRVEAILRVSAYRAEEQPWGSAVRVSPEGPGWGSVLGDGAEGQPWGEALRVALRRSPPKITDTRPRARTWGGAKMAGRRCPVPIRWGHGRSGRTRLGNTRTFIAFY